MGENVKPIYTIPAWYYGKTRIEADSLQEALQMHEDKYCKQRPLPCPDPDYLSLDEVDRDVLGEDNEQVLTDQDVAYLEQN